MSKQLNVLIVDDERPIREGLRDYVPWKELELNLVGCAKNGEKAWEILCETNIDLLITDIEMQKLGGLDLIARIVEHNMRPSVLIISGYSNFKYAKQAIRFHLVRDYILKPIDFTNLIAVIKKMKEEHIARVSTVTIPALKQSEIQKWGAGQANTLNLYESLDIPIRSGEARRALEVFRSNWQTLIQSNSPHSLLVRSSTALVLFLTHLIAELPVGNINIWEDNDPVQLLSLCRNAQEIKDFLERSIQSITDSISQMDAEKKSALVTRTQKLIYANYNQPEFSLQWAAEQLDISSNYLSSKFKEETGVGFVKYLNDLRMEHAKVLLKDLHYKIYQVSEQVGISDHRYFARMFKESTGMTPIEYRNQ